MTGISNEAQARDQAVADALYEACLLSGVRMTGPRRVMTRVIAAAHDHPDVVELHRRAACIDKRIALSTVYRTVKVFEDNGIIERHRFQDGRARYEPAPGEHHDHLINVDTNEVIEFHSEEIERLQAKIAHERGFKLVGHRLELYVVPLDRETR